MQLAAGIRNAAAEALAETATLQVAEEFYDANTALIEPLERDWIIRKLAGWIGKHRAKLRRTSDTQLILEGMLGGFTHLPRKIEIVPGKMVDRGDSTIGPYRKLATQLRKEKSQALEAALRVIELMAPHSKKKRRITWNEVLEKEAKNQEAGADTPLRQTKAKKARIAKQPAQAIQATSRRHGWRSPGV
jgi:hypothetical protein